jgi:hypothetical protein
MTIGKFVLIGALAGLLTLPAAGALAQDDGPVQFFANGQASASWDKIVPAPVGDTDTWSIELTIGDAFSYAGARLVGVAGPPPPATNPPSFDFQSTISGDSGGSPRLVMQFSDLGRLELRPLTWVAGAWAKPLATGWDSNGGACPFKYGVVYAVGLACHAGATVTDVYVVTDSGWKHPTGYTNWIDNIRYGSLLITRPENARPNGRSQN